MTHDDITSYIWSGTNGHKQSLNIDWPSPIGSLGSVFTAAVRYVTIAAGLDPATIAFKFSNAAGTLSTTAIVDAASNAAWTSSSLVDVSNGTNYRPGGGAWTSSDMIDDKTTFFRVTMGGLVDDQEYITSFWGQLEYNPPSGGFTFLLQLAGLSALPFVGHFADFRQFSRYLSWRRRFHPRHTLLTPDEVRKAWREVREYRHPVRSFAWA